MFFRHAHAAHPDWSVAVEECLLLLGQQTTARGFVREPNLGFVYLTDSLAPHADSVLSTLKARTGISSWVGASAAGICATGVEYMDEPALAVMLGQFAPGSFNVFSGTQRPPARAARTGTDQLAAWTALAHADPHTPDVASIVQDMSYKLASGRLYGGVASGRSNANQQPVQIADQVLRGGLSGVVFAQDVPVHTALAQGCFPLPTAREHTVTAAQEQSIVRLDEQRAFDALIEDAGFHSTAPTDDVQPPTHAIDSTLRNALHGLARQGLLVGLKNGPAALDYLIRHVVALDPDSGAVLTTTDIHPDQRVIFCTRDEGAARQDLARVCRQLQGEAPVPIRGAVYISCLGRGGHLFGEQGEELRLIQAELGAVPLVGFYANGEIYGRDLYGYSGVLMLFGASRTPPPRTPTRTPTTSRS